MIRGEGSSTASATAVVPTPSATSFSSSIDAYGSRRGFATGAGTPSTARRNAMPRPRPPARARRFESTRGTRNAASPFAPPPNTSRMPCPGEPRVEFPRGRSLVPAGTSLVPAGTSLVLVDPSSSTPASTFSSSSSSSSDAKGVRDVRTSRRRRPNARRRFSIWCSRRRRTDATPRRAPRARRAAREANTEPRVLGDTQGRSSRRRPSRRRTRRARWRRARRIRPSPTNLLEGSRRRVGGNVAQSPRVFARPRVVSGARTRDPSRTKMMSTRPRARRRAGCSGSRSPRPCARARRIPPPPPPPRACARARRIPPPPPPPPRAPPARGVRAFERHPNGRARRVRDGGEEGFLPQRVHADVDVAVRIHLGHESNNLAAALRASGEGVLGVRVRVIQQEKIERRARQTLRKTIRDGDRRGIGTRARVGSAGFVASRRFVAERGASAAPVFTSEIARVKDATARALSKRNPTEPGQ